MSANHYRTWRLWGLGFHGLGRSGATPRFSEIQYRHGSRYDRSGAARYAASTTTASTPTSATNRRADDDRSMIRIALGVWFCASLAGCAGHASYLIHPFFDKNIQKFVCCEVEITSSKDVANLTAHFVKDGDNYVIDVQESGVGASAPMTAQSKSVSSVSQAVSDTAISAAKIFSH